MEIATILKEKKGTILDVRSYEEFIGGHVAGSFNIPLQEIQHRMQEIHELETPFILCCASGNRSEQAQVFLTAHGIECYNGGSWLNVNYLQAQAEL
jgi:rhodanese-related sulfurtransferase